MDIFYKDHKSGLRAAKWNCLLCLAQTLPFFCEFPFQSSTYVIANLINMKDPVSDQHASLEPALKTACLI